ncbi:phosphatase PAP2 family protein [Ferruginibacter sp.]|uniref:phosphatase PAP2 family protein n=1 Tax=Ferruginibacter sp. TaxID=1940288 RepID=UPI0019C8B6DD|nr:phosphatase PAP2 family protein [Ferruginibacter sp.]MBC7625841.1 phosphatase PAP2 family protein [Ferruginibacter sp.]
MKSFYCCFSTAVVLFALSVARVSAQDTIVVNYPARDTTTIKDVKPGRYLKPAAVILPASLMVYGALKPEVNGIRQLDDNIMANIKKNHADFHTTADDYMMWAPTASIYLMDALHLKTKHSFTEHLILDAGSLIIAGGVGFVMRKISGNIDVYHTQDTKFPSGHTTNAFRGAEIFHQELKDTHPVFSYTGYLVATSVGVLRMYNKSHLLTEVITGAGLGILSGKLTYWIFDKVKYKRKKK